MKPTLTHRSLIAALAVLLAALAAFAKDGAEGRTKDQHSKVSEPTEAPAILATMQSELDRSMAGYSKADPPVYFISYTIADREYAEVSGSNGALLSSTENHARWLEVQTRVGSIKQDNTHKLGDRQPSWTSPGTATILADDLPVLSREIWRETDKQYRAPWEARVRKYTTAFSQSPAVLNSIVTFTALAANQYEVTSEGSKIAFGQIHYRLELYVQSKAPDGMDINRYNNFDWLTPKDAPDDKTVLEHIQTMIQETEALDKAPLVDPYAGPALLTGRAAAVFFHEVFGHRSEGFRQKDINEGQTFTSKIGEQILPAFLS